MDAGTSFQRLLTIAKKSDTGQAGRVASFVAAVIDMNKFDLYDLRPLDEQISDDILLCINFIRWGKLALTDTTPQGMEQAMEVCVVWGYAPTES